MAQQPPLAEKEQKNETQQLLFPPPPPYFHLASQGLQPPLPIQGTYQLFGEYFTTEDGLPPLQVRKIYETLPDGTLIDIKTQLLTLHNELLANFLELLRVLIERPSAYARQVENVGLVLRNMQFLANELRPHQARASLVDALQSDVDSKQKSIDLLQSKITSGNNAMKSVFDQLQ